VFKLIVPEKVLQHSLQQVQKYNFGQRSTANGTPEQQLTGIIGQSMMQQLFGLPLVDGATGCDDGVDIAYAGLSVDVKTMGRTTDVRPYYVNNFLGLQLKFTTDVLVFCSYNKRNSELTVCGWCTKKAFTQKASFYPQGTLRNRSDGSSFKTFSDLYEISNSDLNDVSSIDDLKHQLQKLSANKEAINEDNDSQRTSEVDKNL